MEVLSREEIKVKASEIRRAITQGAVFIHPTDTIYGLGCDATNDKAVSRIRDIKARFKRPFSVIAPSKEWIKENCEITKNAEEWLEKLPGPYTLILKLKNKEAVSENTNMGLDTLGVRIPEHWFSKVVEELGIPVVTTSANKIDQDFMTSLEDLDQSIKAKVDFIMYEGGKKGRPSQLVHLEKEEVTIKKR